MERTSVTARKNMSVKRPATCQRVLAGSTCRRRRRSRMRSFLCISTRSVLTFFRGGGGSPGQGARGEKTVFFWGKNQKSHMKWLGRHLQDDGAGGETRTHKGLPPEDFESSASTNSTTPAQVQALYTSTSSVKEKVCTVARHSCGEEGTGLFAVPVSAAWGPYLHSRPQATLSAASPDSCRAWGRACLLG